MITLIYTAADEAPATTIRTELTARGYPLSDAIQTGREHVTIVLLSPDAIGDPAVQRATEAALDRGQHLIPVLARPVALPDLIDHLAAVDWSGGNDVEALQARLDAALSPDARLPMRARTPAVRAANRRAGLALALLALTIGGIVTASLIQGIIGFPEEEYEAVDTQAAATRDAMIAPTMAFLSTMLPRSTEQAAAFPATLDAIPTLMRPFVALTATAMDELLVQFESAATETPEP